MEDKKEEVKAEEVKEEVKVEEKAEEKDVPHPEEEEKKEEEKSEEKKIKVSKFEDIFITENHTFDIVVKYYKKDDKLYVDQVDDEFDQKETYKDFSVTFKYPDQGDTARITAAASSISPNAENIDVRDLINLEFSRVLCLVRKWTLDQPVNNNNILKLHPKIIKGIVVQMRDLIGMDGII